jgi:4-hydroxy-tetrahydrodipicolinate synthase
MNFSSTLPKGVFTASLTPMNDDLSVNYPALISHLKWLLANGSSGICLLGTTGEANSFSVEERLDVLEAVIKAGIEPKVLLVGTGTCALPDSIRLTRHAVERDVGGVLMLPPFYYKGLSDDGILEYFRKVVEGVADTRLKIYLYHFPAMTGVPFTLDLVKKLVDAYPETIVGIKDSSGDWPGMQAICEALPGFKLYSGTEKYLLNTLRAGGAGCISATFNASIGHGAKVYTNWQLPGADTLQEELSALRTKFEVTSFISGLKYLFAQWLEDDDWLNIRPPNSLPDAKTRQNLLQNLSKEDFFL